MGRELTIRYLQPAMLPKATPAAPGAHGAAARRRPREDAGRPRRGEPARSLERTIVVALLASVIAAMVSLALGGCGPTPVADPDAAPGADDASTDARWFADASARPDAAPSTPDARPDATIQPDATPPGPCPAGADGLVCLFDLYDEVIAGCDAERLTDLRDSLLARRGRLPAWHDGRALFVTWDAPAAVAGDFNGWDAEALSTEAVCGGDLHVADASVPSGRHEYKLVSDGSWILDPENRAFAYDEFAGNEQGRNSVLNTYDSGVGHLVQPADELCSTELDDCRPFTTYLPPGYGAPQNADRAYPVVFMHDGQNIFDDPDCCFGHTGWELNVTLDDGIAADEVPEVVIVGFDHGGEQRELEYAISTADGGLQETFMEFQVEQVQPTAAGYWRLDPDRVYTAGSSYGGLVALRLAFAHPDVYAGAASLSGAFAPGEESNVMADVVQSTGKIDLALYLDHGGTEAGGEDGYAENVALRDLLVDAGWQQSVSPSCTAGSDALCYFHDVGASHDELAWGARAWRFLRFLLS